MPTIKRVIDYSGMNFERVLELPTDVFLLMVKDSIISELESTEEGRDYLEKCKRLNTKGVDKTAFRNAMRKG